MSPKPMETALGGSVSRGRSLSDRWGLEQGCLRVVMALMPAMECFNWPEAVWQPSFELKTPRFSSISNDVH